MAAATAHPQQSNASNGHSKPASEANASLPPGEVACPDPSAHGKDRRLQEQASTAALYVTRPDRATNTRDKSPLGPDGKLSSASAATSLKYAKAQDLPSYPSVGIDTAHSAGSAALMAAGNKTKIEPWKPDASDSAAKAALLAKDYKMAPLWQPELSSAGSKAALLAHRDGGKLNLWMPEASAEGNSAAGLAFRAKGLSPETDYGYTPTGKKNALTAATGALAAGRSGSAPPTPVSSYPDAANSAHNSLNAATVAHKPSLKKKKPAEDSNRLSSGALESARITHAGANVPREMYGSTPPVALEVEEKRRQDALRASAISMAKRMYDVQQAHINEASGINSAQIGARASNARPQSVSSAADLRTQAMQYIGLQEQAQKLAAERLAKITPEDTSSLRSYYGYSNEPARRRLSVRRGRRRAASESEMMVDSDDEEQSRRIRNQMSIFNNQLKEVDEKKRQKDRENLIAAAERKVHAQMHDMDERVFMETGKVPPAIMEDWEAKARAKAAEKSETRMQNHGKVHVGGGKFLDQSEIDAIAAGRVQPTLNEINDAAEAQRARDEEKRLDEEERKRLAAIEKEREAETKVIQKRLREEDKAAAKARKAEGKAAAKDKKEAEKARRDEEKRLRKEDKRQYNETDKHAKHGEDHELVTEGALNHVEPEPEPSSPEHTTGKDKATDKKDTRPDPPVAVPSYHTEVEAIGTIDSSDDEDAENIAQRVVTAPTTSSGPTTSEGAGALPTTADTATTLQDGSAPSSPASPTTKEHRRIRSLFSRLKRRSRGSTGSAGAADPTSPTGSDKSFVGGAALTGATARAVSSSNNTAPTTTAGTRPTRDGRSSPSISSLSSAGVDGDEVRGRGRTRSAASVSISSESEDRFEEAPDRLDEGLAPPPSSRFGGKGGSVGGSLSPARGTRFREDV